MSSIPDLLERSLSLGSRLEEGSYETCDSYKKEYCSLVQNISEICLYSRGGLKTNYNRSILWLPLLGILPFPDTITSLNRAKWLSEHILGTRLHKDLIEFLHYNVTITSNKEEFFKEDEPIRSSSTIHLLNELFSYRTLQKLGHLNTDYSIQIERDIARSGSLFPIAIASEQCHLLHIVLQFIFFQHAPKGLLYTQGFHEVIAMVLRVIDFQAFSTTMHITSTTEDTGGKPIFNYGTDGSRHRNNECEDNLCINEQKKMTTNQMIVQQERHYGKMIKLIAMSERLALLHCNDYLTIPLELSIGDNLKLIGVILREVDRPLFSLLTITSQWEFIISGRLFLYQSLLQTTHYRFNHTSSTLRNEKTEFTVCKYHPNSTHLNYGFLQHQSFDIMCLFGVEFQYCLSWLLTMFTHDLLPRQSSMLKYSLCCRIWDSILAGPPAFPIFLCVGLLRHSIVRHKLFSLANVYGILPDIDHSNSSRYPLNYTDYCDPLPTVNHDLFYGLRFHLTTYQSHYLDLFHMDILNFFQHFFLLIEPIELELIIEDAIRDALTLQIPLPYDCQMNPFQQVKKKPIFCDVCMKDYKLIKNRKTINATGIVPSDNNDRVDRRVANNQTQDIIKTVSPNCSNKQHDKQGSVFNTLWLTCCLKILTINKKEFLLLSSLRWSEWPWKRHMAPFQLTTNHFKNQLLIHLFCPPLYYSHKQPQYTQIIKRRHQYRQQHHLNETKICQIIQPIQSSSYHYQYVTQQKRSFIIKHYNNINQWMSSFYFWLLIVVDSICYYFIKKHVDLCHHIYHYLYDYIIGYSSAFQLFLIKKVSNINSFFFYYPSQFNYQQSFNQIKLFFYHYRLLIIGCIGICIGMFTLSSQRQLVAS